MHLKNNIAKVLKCIFCLVACCMIVVCSIVSPALAASSGIVYSLVDYFDHVYTSEDPDRWQYIVDDLDGSWYSQIGSGSVVFGADSPEYSYKLSAGTSLASANLYYYYLGAELSDGSVQYNYLDISMYNDEYLVSFTTNFEFHMTYFNSPPGDVVVTWMSRVKTYDANFNYLGIVTADKTITLPGGGTSGDTYSSSVDIELSDDVYYIVPYVWFNFNPENTVLADDLIINVKRLSYLSVDLVSDYDRSDEEMAGDRLDNATGDLDNAGDELGDSLDDYNDANSMLPTAPKDFSDVLDDDSLNNAIADAQKIFDWDKSGLNYLFPPMTLSLGLAVLFYVVFGKGD